MHIRGLLSRVLLALALACGPAAAFAQTVPIHWGTHPILAGNPAQLKAALEKRKFGGTVVEMKPGETRNF